MKGTCFSLAMIASVCHAERNSLSKLMMLQDEIVDSMPENTYHGYDDYHHGYEHHPIGHGGLADHSYHEYDDYHHEAPEHHSYDYQNYPMVREPLGGGELYHEPYTYDPYVDYPHEMPHEIYHEVAPSLPGYHEDFGHHAEYVEDLHPVYDVEIPVYDHAPYVYDHHDLGYGHGGGDSYHGFDDVHHSDWHLEPHHLDKPSTPTAPAPAAKPAQ